MYHNLDTLKLISAETRPYTKIAWRYLWTTSIGLQFRLGLIIVVGEILAEMCKRHFIDVFILNKFNDELDVDRCTALETLKKFHALI